MQMPWKGETSSSGKVILGTAQAAFSVPIVDKLAVIGPAPLFFRFPAYFYYLTHYHTNGGRRTY
jgi:hypothetical protein